jgi:hypothetical protein
LGGFGYKCVSGVKGGKNGPELGSPSLRSKKMAINLIIFHRNYTITPIPGMNFILQILVITAIFLANSKKGR